jgi:hypothetical protein
MKKGFRVKPKKDQLQELTTEMLNVQQSVRISQMLLKQMMENMQAMAKDLNRTMGQFNELQYKFLAIKENLNLDSSALDTLANVHRLRDFESAAAAADSRDKLDSSSVVEADSTIVITSAASDTSGQDKGIFRSRLKLSECGVPALIAGLTGKSIGEKVVVKLNDVDHEVELLAIRNPRKEQTQPEATI